MEDIYEDSVSQDEGVDLLRYVRVLLRRWWIVLLIFGAVAVPWTVHIWKQPPEYLAEAEIYFENVAGKPPEQLNQTRIWELTSRDFLKEVTANMGLTLELLKENGKSDTLTRQHVFQTFSTTNEPKAGNYSVRFYPSGDCAIYFKSERLDSLDIDQCIDDTCEYNGLRFSLQRDIWKNRSRLDFKIKNIRGTVESLKSRLRINTDQTGAFMSVALKDKNRLLASETVNMLVGIFKEKSVQIEKERGQFLSHYLRGQLKLVQSELDKTDNQESLYLKDHPRGLDVTIRETAARLSEMEVRIAQMRFSKAGLDTLLSRLDYQSDNLSFGDADRFIIRQITGLPVFETDANMETLRNQLDVYDQRRERLMNTYPEINPDVREISDRIEDIEARVLQQARAKVNVLAEQIVEFEDQQEVENEKLNELPVEVMKRIKYTRQSSANEEIYNILLKQLKEAQISEGVTSEKIDIQKAPVPIRPISSDKMKKAFLGVFFGLSLGIGFVIILEVADKRIKTQDDVKRYMKLTILGVIPKVKFDSYELKDSEKAKSISSQIVTHDYSPTPVGEAYRSLRTSLLFSKNIGPIHSLAIGSVSPGEGKSFTVVNLAITMAQQKSKTLLIDADLRRGVMHNTFNCSKKPGLTNYLTGVVPLENVLNETYIPNLTLITCGSLIPNPSELLGSVKMKRFIEGITKRFDFVLFDTPPLNAATDTIILGTLVDGVAVLVRAGQTNRDDVRRKMELFQNVQVKILGAILNCAGVEVAHEGYSYYRY
jgi:tyrosine-protein kinase Etk/Wzc